MSALTSAEHDELMRRVAKLGEVDVAEDCCHHLGEFTLNGRQVKAHIIHAVDAIITDGESVVMINRKNDPGKGKPALPGGFIDPQAGGAEGSVIAATREAQEEAGISLNASDGKMVGHRRMQRPHDIRIARKDMPQYGIKEGDVFTVSTQSVFFYVPDLKQKKLTAGDDALPGSARLVALRDITSESVGIVDHEAMIVEAMVENAPMLQAKGINPETMIVGSAAKERCRA